MAEISVTPDKLREIKRTCDTQKGAVEEVKRAVKGSIDSSGWVSPAATKFNEDWTQRFEPALTELGEALLKLGTAANTMATNYDETEQAYRGG